MRLFRLIAFIILFCNYATAQSLVITDITGISFRDENYVGTPNKTLEYLKYEKVQQKMLKELYRICSKRWDVQPDSSYPTNFQLLKRGDKPVATRTVNKQHSVSITITELTASELLQKAAEDAEDVQKMNGLLAATTATYQVIVQYAPVEGSASFKTGFFLVQRRPGVGFGLYSPEYDTSPTGFQSMLQRAVQVLLDTASANGTIQVVGAQPAVYADNFMMPYQAGRSRIQTIVNSPYFRFNLTADTTILMRFDSSRFLGINMEAKNTTLFPQQIRKAIELGRKNRSYQFAVRQQEFRSVLADNNYFSSIIEMADPAYLDGYSSYLKYMPGNDHILLRNNDTIARFQITVWKAYPERKFYFNRVYNGVDSNTMLEVDMPNIRNTQYETPQEFEGLVFGQAFKIIAAPTFAYREIYFNNHLVILAKGNRYPESMIIMDTTLPASIVEALLVLAFIETEPMMGFKNL